MKNFYNNLKNGLTSVRVGNTLDSILSRICLASLILMTIGVGQVCGAVTRKFYAGVGVVGDGVAQVQMDWKWGLSSGTIGTAKSNDANPYLEDNPSRVYASSIPNYRARYSISSTGTGYTFKYWCNAKGDSITNSDPWTAQDYNNGGWVITYYAKFTPNDYTIVYIGNGSTHGATASTPATYDDNVTFAQNGFYRAKYIVTYDANGGACSLEADTAYYSFEGWATSAGGAKVYDGGQTTTSAPNLATSGNTNLYAKWGSGTTAVTLPTSSDLTAPVYDGDGEYSFAGWYVSTDENKEVLGVSYTPTSNVTLKAKWTLTKEPRFSGAVEGTSHTLKVGETFNFKFENTSPTTPSSSSSDNFYYVISQTTDPTGNRDGSEHPNDVISISGNTITALNNGVATIKFYQKADESKNIAAGESATFTFTVSRNVPEFTWNTREHYYYNETIAHFFKSSQTETAISVTSTDAHKLIATIVDSALVMYNKAGTARVTMTQAENYYWEEHTEYRDITPEKANTHVEFTVTSANQASINVSAENTGYVAWDSNGFRMSDGTVIGDRPDNSVILKIEGIPDSLFFTMNCEQNGVGAIQSYPAANDYTFEVYERVTTTGEWKWVWTCDNSSWFSAAINQKMKLDSTTQYLRLRYKGSCWGRFENIRVTELKRFKTDSTSFDFKTNLKNANVPSKSFEFKHANAGYTVKAELSDSTHYQISLDNLSFSGSVIIPNTGGDRMDSSVVYVKYYPSATGDAEETHNATITFSDQLSNSAIVTLTGKTQAKLSTHLVYKGAASYAVNADNIAATDLFEVRDANNALVSNPTITLSAAANSFFDLANSNTELDPKCGGSATITAHYAGDETYAAASNLDQTITIARLADEISFNNGKIVLVTGNVENLTTWNITSLSQAEGANITFTTSNSSILSVTGNTLTAVAKGTAKLYAHSENTCTYAAGVDSLVITVRNPDDPCETTSYLNTSKKQIMVGSSLEETITPGMLETLTVSVRAQLLAQNSNQTTIQLLDENNVALLTRTIQKGNDELKATSYKTINFDLTEIANIQTAKTIKITGNGTTYYQEYNSIKITQQMYLNHTGAKNIAMTSVKACEPATHDVTINYSDVSTIQMRHKNDDFSYTVVNGNSNGEFNNDCGDFGTFTLRATVNPLTKGEYKDSIFLTASGLCDTIVLTLNATKPEREIVWNQDEISTATATTNTDLVASVRTKLCLETAGTVTFTIHAQSEEGVASLSGNVLSFHKQGTVTVKASAAETDDYLAAADVTKTWNVSKVGASMATLPTITSTITCGDELSAVTYNEDWQAVSVLNANDVIAGHIIKTGPASFTTAGDAVVNFNFYPTNVKVYDVLEFTVPITVQHIASNATPSAEAITYGEAIGSSTLSNSGTTAGTWTWNTENNDAVLDAGEHTLNVHFTPENSNYSELDATVTLKVNKATTSLNWTNAPEDLAYNATGVTYTASSASDGVITYSITAGGAYAHIDSESGVLTIDEPGHQITIQASQAASTNYNAASPITVDITIAAAPAAPTFTNATNNNDWQTAGNWSNGEVPSGENPNVIISGELIINEDVTVGGLTILPTGSVAVVTNGTLTIKGTSESRSEYGNLFVANGGEVDVNGTLHVGDLTVEASIGTENGSAESGQIAQAEHIAYANAYIEINMVPDGGPMDDSKWYGFTVPFAVNAYTGIAHKEGNNYVNCNYGSDIIIAEYDAIKRLNSGNGWKYISSPTLNPGQFYFFGADGGYNTFRFKASASSYTPAAAASLSVNGSTTNPHANWNGVGNSMLQHATASYAGGSYVQVYKNGLDAYEAVPTGSATFVVGCPFFVQATEATTLVLNVQNEVTAKYYAPSRVDNVEKVACVQLASVDGGYADHVYVSATDKEQNAYMMGHDLSKAGISAIVPQLWVNQYNQQLCVHEAALQGNNAACALGIYAPKSGDYLLSVAQTDNAEIYLTMNGQPIWNLSQSEYLLSLNKGTNDSYGLMMVNAPQVTTGVDEFADDNAQVSKIILNNQLYIIKNGQVFDATGKKVQ